MTGSPRPSAFLLFVALTVAAGASPATATAQDSTGAAVSGWRIGGSIGVPGWGGEVLFPAATVGMHFAYLPRGPLGLDLSVGTAPVLIALGGLNIGARAGVAVPVRTASLLVVPSAGASMIGAVSTPRPDGSTGGYVGVAFVADTGTRTGVTMHWLGGDPRPVWLFEVGFLRLPRP